MRILIVQLARFGDIYTTWPTVRELSRKYPQAEIDLLVRERFRDACQGLSGVNVLVLKTSEILTPLLQFTPSIEEALAGLGQFTEQLRERGYDQVINLSFSPFSSYLVKNVASKDAVVRGYTRHADDFLAIADDASAYFYAQVGLGKPNRVHLTDLFAAIAGVELSTIAEPVCQSGEGRALIEKLTGRVVSHYIVCHLGASDLHKAYGEHKWANLLRGLSAESPHHLILIGSASERETFASLLSQISVERVIDLVGKTTLPDLLPLITDAELVIGGDSAPMHIASLVDTPCLNLSFATVNFWETGPRAKGSRVFYADSPDSLPSDQVVAEVKSMLGGSEPSPTVYVGCVGVPSYCGGKKADDLFAWDLVRAVYLGGDWPPLRSKLQREALIHLREINDLALEQLNCLENSPHDVVAKNVLDRVDEIMVTIGQMEPSISPLVRWHQTEKVRLGPGSLSDLIRKTVSTHVMLKSVINVYANALKNAARDVAEDEKTGREGSRASGDVVQG